MALFLKGLREPGASFKTLNCVSELIAEPIRTLSRRQLDLLFAKSHERRHVDCGGQSGLL